MSMTIPTGIPTIAITKPGKMETQSEEITRLKTENAKLKGALKLACGYCSITYRCSTCPNHKIKQELGL